MKLRECGSTLRQMRESSGGNSDLGKVVCDNHLKSVGMMVAYHSMGDACRDNDIWCLTISCATCLNSSGPSTFDLKAFVVCITACWLPWLV